MNYFFDQSKRERFMSYNNELNYFHTQFVPRNEDEKKKLLENKFGKKN